MSDRDRRKAPRRPTNVTLEVFDPEGQLIIGVGRLADVSILGGRFLSNASLAQGQGVRVQFKLGTGEMLELHSRVIWVNQEGARSSYGIAFEHPTAAQMKQLEAWIDSHPESSRSSRPKTSCTLGMIPGDGVGPEVLGEAVKVLNACANRHGVHVTWVTYDFGGERTLRTGEALPDSALEEFRKLDALLLGPIGHPQLKLGVLERDFLRKLRFGLDQYVKLMPCRVLAGASTPLKEAAASRLDVVLVSENLEGLSMAGGEPLRRGSPEEAEPRIELHTRRSVERCVRYAFDYLRQRRQRKTLTLVDDAQAMVSGQDLWRRVFEQVGEEYSDVEKETLSVGEVAAALLQNPGRFDGLVGHHRVGAYLSELLSALSGGLGIAAVAEMNPHEVSTFRPLHGSLPAMAAKGEANPLAAIVAGALLLEALGHVEASKNVEKAVRASLASGKIKSTDVHGMGLSTAQIGDLVVSNL